MNMCQKFTLPFKQQRGIILPITLIALLILLIASVALIQSTNTSLQISGNLAFKRDVINQAGRVSPIVQTLFTTGNLSSQQSRENNLIASNYYANIQPSNNNGIPNVLLNTTTFDNTFANNIIIDNASQITIRYVIDRMCIAAGPATNRNCTSVALVGDSCDGSNCLNNIPPVSPVYRISIRATGPRNTEVFLQSTFSI